jgi:UDP-N-acetylglucosamine acyltransferase
MLNPFSREGKPLLLNRFLKRPSSDHPVESVTEPVLRPANAPRISAQAVVHPKAKIGDDCEIGPFCIVGPDVTLGNGCRLLSHAVITGYTTAGCDNTFHPNCVIGGPPQDKKFRGERTQLIIGDRNDFRESVTVNLGTQLGGGITRIGDDNLLMVNCHVGHDCQIGNRAILSNNVMLAGHMVIGNNVVMSGGSAAHHYVSIGDYAFVAGMARINKDVPPFVKVSDQDKVRAINSEGLRRAGFSEGDIEAIEAAGRRVFFNREKPTMAAALADFDLDGDIHPQVRLLIAFLRRRYEGKHGRYLESLRPKKVSAERGVSAECKVQTAE